MALPDLDADGVLDAAQVFDVRAAGIVGAQPDPGKVRQQVEVAGAARHTPGLRRFIAQVQGLVRGEEIDLVGIAGAHSEHVLDELQRVLDGLHHAVVFRRQGGVARPVDVEIFGVVEVGEAALDQGAHEVQHHGGAFVAAEQELGIGPAGLGGEFGAVDVIAAIGRQADAVAGLLGGGARLGVLAGEASDADYRTARAHHQNQRHLEQDFERVGDARRRAIDEALGAIAALEHELASFGGLGQLFAQVQNLPTGDQRGQDAEFVEDTR